MVFDGQTIPFVLMPHFVSPGQSRRVRSAVACLSRVLGRFCDAYPGDAALREELALSDFEDDLVRIDPGYPNPVRSAAWTRSCRATRSGSSSSTRTRPPASGIPTCSTRGCARRLTCRA